MQKAGQARPSTPNTRAEQHSEQATAQTSGNHWSQGIHEASVTTGSDGTLNLTVEGGSDNGEFAYLGEVNPESVECTQGSIESGEVLLEIQGQRVAGYTQRDVVAWLNHCCRSGAPIHLKLVRGNSLTKDLHHYLNTRFQKGSVDHDLQNTIRDNLYLRTVPVTTRPPREGEVNGVDYTFLSPEEFMALEQSGNLLESGVFEGNHYGTPKPPKESPVSPPHHADSSSSLSNPGGGAGDFIPGVHPSSEGKRRRNRSNVVALAGNNMDPELDTTEDLPQSPLGYPVGRPYTPTGSSLPMIPQYPGPSGHYHDNGPDSPQLGPLPPNWEKAYTERGEVYFIDHNCGTSHWLDPRLSRVQKKSLEDCLDDELPYGWEKIDDPHYGTYYIDHVNRRTQYENPVLQAKRAAQVNDTRPFFTRNPNELEGERIQTSLMKSSRGLGFTIVGGDDAEEDFLQIKSVVPNGPAWLDGKLNTGDVLVFVNNTCVLGFTHHDMVSMFQCINPGEMVSLEVCRGYPLHFDPDDPNTEIVTTMAVNAPEQRSGYMDHDDNSQDELGGLGNLIGDTSGLNGSQDSVTRSSARSMPDLSLSEKVKHVQQRPGSADLLLSDGNGSADPPSPVRKPEFLSIPIVKGPMGFGFTIADSAYGQKVKKILDRARCKNLIEGDILVDINSVNVRNMNHGEVVQVLKDCTREQEAAITVQRGGFGSPGKGRGKKAAVAKDTMGAGPGLYRSKTPTADLYSTRPKEVLTTRPKTPLVDTRNRPKTPTSSGRRYTDNNERYDLSAGPQSPTSATLADQMMQANLQDYSRSRSPGNDLDSRGYGYGYDYGVPNSGPPPPQQHPQLDTSYNITHSPAGYDQYDHHDPNQSVSRSPSREYYSGHPGYNSYGRYDQGYNYGTYLPVPGKDYGLPRHDSGYNSQNTGYNNNNNNNGSSAGYYQSDSLGRRKESTSFEYEQPHPSTITRFAQENQRPPMGSPGNMGGGVRVYPAGQGYDWAETTVILMRQESGFGFRIVGGTEEGSQVSIGHIVPGGAADLDGRLSSGDEIISVDGQRVVNTSHRHVVQLMGQAAANGRVTLGIRRRVANQEAAYQKAEVAYPYDVTVTRRENEGFGFVIISSVNKAGSTIGRIIDGSPAERCVHLHVGDRILAVNHIDIMNMHHGDIVNLIKDSGYSVTLTIGPPLDDASSTASTSHREEQEVMEEEQYYAVELNRGTRGFGFSIRGGKEFQCMPLFVLRIAENGPASMDGRLRIGDQIIEINSTNTKSMTHTEAIEIIKNGGPAVRLLVKRGGKVPPAIEQATAAAAASPVTPMSPMSPNSPMVPPPNSAPPPTPTSAPPNHNQISTTPIRPSSSLSQGSKMAASPNMASPNMAASPNMDGMNAHHVPMQPGQGYPSALPHNGLLNGPISHSSPRVGPGAGVGQNSGYNYWGQHMSLLQQYNDNRS